MNKTIGYVLLAVGLIIFLLSFQAVAAVVKIPMPAGLTSNIIMIVGVIVLAVGAFIVSKGSGGKKVEDVPIYGGKGGKDVVGFRRIQK